MIKRLTSFVCSGLVAVGVAVTGLQPAQAGVANPVAAVKPVAGQTAASGNVVEVGRRHHRPRHRRHWRHHHHKPRLGLYFHFGSPGYYRSYPRYAYPRRVYPRHVYPKRVYRSHGLSSAHVRWCDSRYRSYRVSDNTFQPYHGPRRPCRSPYY